MKNGLEVYDFKEEDELAEYTADKKLEKFKNPSLDDPAILKYEFLQCGTTIQKKGIGNVLCVNVDAISSDPSCDNAITYLKPGPHREEVATSPKLNSTTSEQLYFKQDKCASGCSISELATRDLCHDAPCPAGSEPKSGISASQSKNKLVDGNSDADGNVKRVSPSSPSSAAVDCCVSTNDQISDCCVDDSEPDDIDMAVVVCPDYVVYRGTFHSGSLIMFTCNGIKIKDLTAGGKKETVTFERAIDDIIDIKCRWFQRVGSVLVKVQLLPRAVVQDGFARGTSGIEELQFAVIEPNWSEKQEKVVSLNAKYMAAWNVELDVNAEVEGNSHGKRQYFPNFEDPFEDVVYPKGEADAVSISKRDVDLLHPETFINDTIIDFYIKYLQNQIQPEEKNRFHFFNSFFFRKLADLDKDPSSISDGRAAFLRVRKWTRKVDIFGKDYVFIPVNYNLHWSLIVICHPGEVTVFKDEDLNNAEKVPCILHMDSIKGTHAGLKNLVQRYLWEEWKERCKETSDDDSSKFLNLRFVPLELPQQENSFDCGLFLLHYLELFLSEAPVGFNPFKLKKFSSFLNTNWFPPAEASLKRTLIQNLIFELLENRAREVKSAVCYDEPHASRVPGNNLNGMGFEILSEKCTTSTAQNAKLSNFQGSQGTAMSVLAAASMKNVQSVNGSNMGMQNLFEPGATSGSLLAGCQLFSQPSSFYPLQDSIVSTREQADDETQEEFVYMQSGETNYHEMNRMTPQEGSIPDLSRGFEDETMWNTEISMRAELDSSPETSDCASYDSDIEVIDCTPVVKDAIQPQKGTTENDHAVEVSEKPEKLHNSSENTGIFSSQEDPTTSLADNPNATGKGFGEDAKMLKKSDVLSVALKGIDEDTYMVEKNDIPSDEEKGFDEEAKMVEKVDAPTDEVQKGFDEDAKMTETSDVPTDEVQKGFDEDTKMAEKGDVPTDEVQKGSDEEAKMAEKSDVPSDEVQKGLDGASKVVEKSDFLSNEVEKGVDSDVPTDEVQKGFDEDAKMAEKSDVPSDEVKKGLDGASTMAEKSFLGNEVDQVFDEDAKTVEKTSRSNEVQVDVPTDEVQKGFDEDAKMAEKSDVPSDEVKKGLDGASTMAEKSFLGNEVDQVFDEDTKTVEKTSRSNEVQVAGDDHQVEPCEQQDVKRRRLSPPTENKGDTESLSKDLHL